MTAPSFRLTADELGVVGAVLVALTQLGQREHANVLAESAVELDGLREPRAADAWRFFQGARALRTALPGSCLARDVLAIGRRIGAAALGVEVIDGHSVVAGGSDAIAFRCDGGGMVVVPDFPRPMGAR